MGQRFDQLCSLELSIVEMYSTSPSSSSDSPASEDFPVETVRGFSFPLNVYAWLLVREFGGLRYLHYGIFDDPQTPVLQAQDQASQMLMQLLPGPCRLLEVGIGLGTTLALLLSQGYHCVGVTPDQRQIELARQRHGAAFPVVETRLEDFNDAAGQWRVLLFQESGQYINTVDLFSKAATLLAIDGEIVWADEFAYRRSDPGEEHLHQLDHVIALAKRFGFELVSRHDCGSQAAPTLDYLHRAVTHQSRALQADLGLSSSQISGLTAALQDFQSKYAQGRYGYAFLKFRRAGVPVWTPNWIAAHQSVAMRGLFEQAFGQTMSQAMWDWKYGGGRGQAIGVWQDGQLIAHYGGVSRHIMYFGRPEWASQSADVMALPHARQSLGRASPFFTAAATYLEQSVGFGRRHLLGVGFPNERARRAAELLGLYGGPVGRLIEIAWKRPVKTGLSEILRQARPIDSESTVDRAVVNRLWARMSKALAHAVVGVRDADWLTYRYAQHPHHRYRLLLVTGALGRPLGVSVVRDHDDGRVELMDVIAAPRDISAVVEKTLQFVSVSGIKPLFAWICESMQPWFGSVDSVSDLGIGISTNAWTAGPSAQELVNHWWLMGGDTDFK